MLVLEDALNLKRKTKIHSRSKMGEQGRHGSRSKIGVHISRQLAFLGTEELRKEGLSGQESDRQSSRHGVRRFQYALALSVEKNQAALAAEEEEKEGSANDCGHGCTQQESDRKL